MGGESNQKARRIQRVSLWGGPILAGLVLIPSSTELSVEAQRLAALTVLMATWWMAEVIPIAVTALIPLALFPIAAISPAPTVAKAYGHDLIWLFFGGFQLAFAVEKCGLHRRMALGIVSVFGTEPRRLILGFMMAVGLLSMWLLNTSTTLMMLPVAMAVAKAIDPDDKMQFGAALMLGLAYAASVGGMGTYLGTAPNGVFRGVAQARGMEVSFGGWMAFALPLSILLIVVIWFYLTRMAFRFESFQLGSNRVSHEALAPDKTPFTAAEKSVGLIFFLAVSAWISRRWVTDALDIAPKVVTDATIAIVVTLALFLVTSTKDGVKQSLLSWEDTSRTPWHILILFGGGFALAQSFSSTGLSLWLGKQLSIVTSGWPIFLLILAVVLFMTFLTEVTSNTATATVLLPVIMGLAVAGQIPPLVLMLPATMAASCAFMLPVATPPNAIVYGSGLVSLPQMAKVGLWVNLLTALIISLWVLTWGDLVFGCAGETGLKGFCR